MPATPATPVISVVGIGLSGPGSLSPAVLKQVSSATLLIGAQRHLDAMMPALKEQAARQVPPETWALRDFSEVFKSLRSRLQTHPHTRAVVLATGDPLFFGIGRLLLTHFAPEQLAFYPQLSAIQLAFSRLKVPWHDATLLSVHGRGEALLTQAVKRGDRKIAVLTDSVLSPSAIARLVSALDLPVDYQLWVCENLGGQDEAISLYEPQTDPSFSALNVVVLLRTPESLDGSSGRFDQKPASQPSDQNAGLSPLRKLPLIGLPDAAFQGFADRPLLLTKREIRLLILGAIAPLDAQTFWDIGAGTGSVSVELSRLCPHAEIYAIEKTAMGAALITKNAERLAIAPIHVVQGKAPTALRDLPDPDCIFIGGSSGQLVAMLDYIHRQRPTTPRIVLALATLEHLSEVTVWMSDTAIAKTWQSQLTQINIARSLPVGPLTRFSPLNPVIIVALSRASRP